MANESTGEGAERTFVPWSWLRTRWCNNDDNLTDKVRDFAVSISTIEGGTPN